MWAPLVLPIVPLDGLDVDIALIVVEPSNTLYFHILVSLAVKVYVRANVFVYPAAGDIALFDKSLSAAVNVLIVGSVASYVMLYDLDALLPALSYIVIYIASISLGNFISTLPSFATYAATKSYVLSLSRALNKELKDKNITVTAVCPGPVKTEFFDVAEKHRSVKLYKKLGMSEAKKVVSLALNDGYHGRSVSVYGPVMRAFRILSKLLPHELMLKFIN